MEAAAISKRPPAAAAAVVVVVVVAVRSFRMRALPHQDQELRRNYDVGYSGQSPAVAAVGWRCFEGCVGSGGWPRCAEVHQRRFQDH